MAVGLFGSFGIRMILEHQERKWRHESAVLVDAGRKLLAFQSPYAFSSVLSLMSIITGGCNARQDGAAGIATGVLAEGASPAVIVPRNTNGEMMNR
ncbi:hypothetical protein GALL_514070 [mine drainage metagenome]|uniref:Uncharacterized protein n=1 Tax=mine drainage metagenome TaxID=410659 RepID=A0A1J5P734_9ZZZZ